MLADHSKHPPYVCRICTMKIKRDMKVRRGHARGVIKWDVPDFGQAVNDPSCPSVASTSAQNVLPVNSGCNDMCSSLCQHFIQKAKGLAEQCNFIDCSSTDSLVFATLESGTAVPLINLFINENLTWNVTYKNVPVPLSDSVISEMPEKLNINNVSELFLKVSSGVHYYKFIHYIGPRNTEAGWCTVFSPREN